MSDVDEFEAADLSPEVKAKLRDVAKLRHLSEPGRSVEEHAGELLSGLEGCEGEDEQRAHLDAMREAAERAIEIDRRKPRA